MKDSRGTEIALNQIVQYKNFKTGKLNYYYVDTSNFNYLWLFKYDNKGNVDKSGLDNIKIDPGVGLLNDEDGEWIVLGNKEEIYNRIFIDFEKEMTSIANQKCEKTYHLGDTFSNQYIYEGETYHGLLDLYKQLSKIGVIEEFSDEIVNLYCKDNILLNE